jgi:hypothetical protein
MFKRTLIAYFLIAFCACTLPVFGQKPVIIKLNNPSFEDYPGAAHTPKGWFDCGFTGESAPDVQPSGLFSCTKLAYKDSTYIGMVVRDNNTWEALGQKLRKQLLKNVKYSFSLYACQSELYMGTSQLSGTSANYTTPSIIRIWGGNDLCKKTEMLAESPLIDFKDWKKLDFTFSPKANYRYFTIEAFYKVPTAIPYNGNILIDNASAIVPILDKND